MPSRIAVAEELAEIFKIIAHPDRIRIIEELRNSECGVNELAEKLDLRSTRVSQHLSLMKAHRLVEERREGRHHFYSLSQPLLAAWIVDALTIIEGRLEASMADKIEKARTLWSADPSEQTTVEDVSVASPTS